MYSFCVPNLIEIGKIMPFNCIVEPKAGEIKMLDFKIINCERWETCLLTCYITNPIFDVRSYISFLPLTNTNYDEADEDSRQQRLQRPASLQSRAKPRYVLIMFGDATAWENRLIRCVTEWNIFHSHHGPGWNRSSCERCFSARSERLQIYKLVGNIFVSASFVLWARNHWRDKRGMKFSTRLLTFQVLSAKS